MTRWWQRLQRILRQAGPTGGDPPGALAVTVAQRDGAIRIAGGQVQVTDPAGEGRWPVLHPGDGVTVLVNGEVLTRPAVVHTGLPIDLQVTETPATRLANVAIAGDSLSAYLILGPTRAIRSEIVEQPAQPEVVPRAVGHEVTLPPPSPAAVAELLAAKGVVHGIDEAALAAALAWPEPGAAVVARATPPVPSQPTPIQLLLPPVTEGAPVSVAAGTVLAQRAPAARGAPGRDVRGQALPPPVIGPVSLQAGAGTVLSPDGQQVLAAIPGVPAVESSPATVRITVQPLLVHRGNLEHLSEGPIHEGDILVDGWVEFTGNLHATGRLHITGGVQMSRVAAGAEVHILGGCIRSRVQQGGESAVIAPLRKHLARAAAELTLLHETIQQAVDHPRYARGEDVLGPLVQVLVRQRFPGLTDMANRLSALEGSSPGHESGSLTALKRLAARLCRTVLDGDIADPAELATLTGEIHGHLAVLPAATGTGAAGRVVVYHLLHSQIEAAGAVEVQGPGVEHSEIHAGGDVSITGHLRNSRVYGGGNADLGRIGTPTGSSALVAIPDGGIITARHIFPGCVVEIGSATYRFTQEAHAVMLRLNPAGEIGLYHL